MIYVEFLKYQYVLIRLILFLAMALFLFLILQELLAFPANNKKCVDLYEVEYD